MAKLKHCLILTLAAVFSIVGVVSLLTSPALAAGAITPQNCQTRAEGIIERAIEDRDALLIPPDKEINNVDHPVSCFNPCSGEDESTIRRFFLRDIPGQGSPVAGDQSGIQVAITLEYTHTGHMGYGATLGGQIAFDCSPDDPNTAGPFFVVVGHSKNISTCGTDLTQVLCSTDTAP